MHPLNRFKVALLCFCVAVGKKPSKNEPLNDIMWTVEQINELEAQGLNTDGFLVDESTGTRRGKATWTARKKRKTYPPPGEHSD